MSNFERCRVSILGKFRLLNSALEMIVSELRMHHATVEDASDIAADVDLVLLSFGSTETLRDAIAVLKKRPTPPHLVLFPQVAGLLDSLHSLPDEVAAVVQPGMGHEEIKSVISLVADGHRIVPFSPREDGPPKSAPSATARASDVLTERQLEILREVAKGQTNKAIARNLGISINTVEAHVSCIIRKLNVQNRTQAALALNEPEPEPSMPEKRGAEITHLPRFARKSERSKSNGRDEVQTAWTLIECL